MSSEEAVDVAVSRFELQKSLFEKGFDQVQEQIIHLDGILFKIKGSAITVWVALMGWSFTSSKPEIALLGVVVIIGFWLLESLFKGTQIRYISVSSKLMQMVNDTDSLQRQYEAKHFEPGLIYPVALKLTEVDRLILMVRGIISPTVATIYLFLGFANSLVWMATL